MAENHPQRLSVKRKANEEPVELLVMATEENLAQLQGEQGEQVAHGKKKLRQDLNGGTVVWKLEKSGPRAHTPPVGSARSRGPARRYRLTQATGSVVLVEDKSLEKDVLMSGTQETEQLIAHEPNMADVPLASIEEPPSAPRKRPGAASVVRSGNSVERDGEEPSAEKVRDFEKFSRQVEEGDKARPAKAKRAKAGNPPRNPDGTFQMVPVVKMRRSKSHPVAPYRMKAEASVTPPATGQDNGHLGSDGSVSPYVSDHEFVAEHYYRYLVPQDEDGKFSIPQGTVGYIVLTEADEEFWGAVEEADNDDHDSEDENAEDHYTNDYPEDELDSDDEYEENPYNHYESVNNWGTQTGSDDDAEEGSEEGQFRETVPYARGLFWGRADESGMY